MLSFIGVVMAGTKTVLSLHAVRTNKAGHSRHWCLIMLLLQHSLALAAWDTCVATVFVRPVVQGYDKSRIGAAISLGLRSTIETRTERACIASAVV